jgi:two-component system response regulator YesN
LEDINEFHTLLEVREYSIKKIKFFSQCRREKRDSKSKIVQIIKFIESNYMNNELSIKMISEHTFLSVTYMCSIFKQETNNTINQYLTDYRIEKAKDLLKNKNYNVSEIAENVGFSDGQYFAKTFKKKTSFTPSEFREK